MAFEARSSPPHHLNDQEKKQLVYFLIGCVKVEYAKSCKEVLVTVQSLIAKKQQKDSEEISVTSGWLNSFRKCHHLAYTVNSKQFVICSCCCP